MEEECSPMIDIVGDVTKTPLPEFATGTLRLTLLQGEQLAMRPKLTSKMSLICVSLHGSMTLERLRL
jgi:hypothetical protein